MWGLTNEEFTGLMQQYQKLIYTVCLQFVHDPHTAEDLTQDTFVAAFSAIDRCEPQYYKAWLVRVAVNECKRLLRSPWRRRTGPLEEAGEPAFDTPEQSELFHQVMALPPKYRAAIYLHYYEGYPVSEIAAAMGANPSTVQTWLMRARGRLQANLKEAQSE